MDCAMLNKEKSFLGMMDFKGLSLTSPCRMATVFFSGEVKGLSLMSVPPKAGSKDGILSLSKDRRPEPWFMKQGLNMVSEKGGGKVMAVGTVFNDILEKVSQLSEDEQEMLTEIIRNRMRERRREEIAWNAKETYEAIKKGEAKSGLVEDIKRDLEEE